MIEAMRNRSRHRLGSDETHNAATKPRATATSVEQELTSKLFFSRIQFIRSKALRQQKGHEELQQFAFPPAGFWPRHRKQAPTG
jgi:hypothetical protein